VVIEEKVYVYNFQHLELADSFATYKNPAGLVSLSIAEDNCVLAFPDEKVGHAKIVKQGNSQKEPLTVKCHDSPLAVIKLSQDGNILVTASDKGTLLRVFDTETGEKINEVRRGADQAVITDITIDSANHFMACCSDKGTVHVFSLKPQVENKKSNLSALSGVVGYFGSTWSF